MKEALFLREPVAPLGRERDQLTDLSKPPVPIVATMLSSADWFRKCSPHDAKCRAVHSSLTPGGLKSEGLGWKQAEV